MSPTTVLYELRSIAVANSESMSCRLRSEWSRRSSSRGSSRITALAKAEPIEPPAPVRKTVRPETTSSIAFLGGNRAHSEGQSYRVNWLRSNSPRPSIRTTFPVTPAISGLCVFIGSRSGYCASACRHTRHSVHLVSQIADVNVHDVGWLGKREVPHLLRNLLSGHLLSSIAHSILQQSEFLRRQLDHSPGTFHGVLHPVQR